MNKFFLTFSFLLALCIKSYSQQVYVCKYVADADIKIFVTQYKSEATLKVYVTEYKADAKGIKGIWYFTKYKTDADWKVFFTK